MLGDVPRFVSTPATDAFDFADQAVEPATAGAVAPGAPLPKTIVIVAPPESVMPDTVIVCAATETAPVLAVVYPGLPAVVLGAFQPAGTTTVTLPLLVPPV